MTFLAFLVSVGHTSSLFDTQPYDQIRSESRSLSSLAWVASRGQGEGKAGRGRLGEWKAMRGGGWEKGGWERGTGRGIREAPQAPVSHFMRVCRDTCYKRQYCRCKKRTNLVLAVKAKRGGYMEGGREFVILEIRHHL